ncbi:ABC transporter permease subunit [Bacillus sp. FJAT-27251]|uniref:ABC transporter permease n=1 Tax=Bacillus sp. FJAT-27251 TaxID=1684142 RepID=UPI0006A7EA99|nr:ABC transporter permease subunit [Bacillus sp. FJAT-27251]
MSLLIKNELGKIFGKKSSWIYMLVIVIAVILAGVLQERLTDGSSSNWREETQANISQLQQDLESAPEEQKEWMAAEIQQQQVYLDENIDPNARSNWHFMNETVYGVTVLVTLFAVIVSSASVSAEFSDGTIKQLLIRPHQRWVILLSKYVSVILYSLMLLIVLIAAGFMIGSVIFGSGEFNGKFFEMTLEGQKLAELGPQFFLKVLYYLPSLLMVITISFMLSTLFKSQSLAVGVGIFVLFISSTLGGLIVFLAEKYTWAKFLIFPHLDLTVYALQDEILQDVTLPVSLLTLAVYYVLFIALTFTIFQKRDVSI